MKVSCVIPTYNRPQFIQKAVQYFLDQTYLDAEVIIVDDGMPIDYLLPNFPGLTYIHLDWRDKKTVGHKRNVGAEQATGDFILNWDDDDWSAPNRIQKQLRFHLDSGRDVTGDSFGVFHDLTTGEFNRYTLPSPWVLDATLMYSKYWWKHHLFIDSNERQDLEFQTAAKNENALARNASEEITYVATTHSGNTCPREAITKSSLWAVEPKPVNYPL